MTKSETRKLDKKWKDTIRSKGRCEITGKTKDQAQLHPHHYYGRKNRATRWYLPNGFCLSASKHKLDVWSAHEAPEWFRTQAIKLRGRRWLNDLNKQAHKKFDGSYQEVDDYLNGLSKNYC